MILFLITLCFMIGSTYELMDSMYIGIVLQAIIQIIFIAVGLNGCQLLCVRWEKLNEILKRTIWMKKLKKNLPMMVTNSYVFIILTAFSLNNRFRTCCNIFFQYILINLEKLKRNMFMKIILTIIGPFWSLVVLYYGDILSDVGNMITFYQNCHLKYFGLSFGILVMSYFTTVLYLRFNLNETWTRAVSYHGIHVKYYLLQIYRDYNAIWRNGEELPAELEKEKSFAHNISFLEVTSESIPQLCLQVVVLREFGISNDAREGFFQVTGLLTSLISFCLIFAKVS